MPALRTPDRIRLSWTQLRSLAAGYGDPAAIRALSAGQYSRRLLLIRAVADRARAGMSRSDASGVDDVLRVLSEAFQQAPTETAQVFTHPYLGAWARRCLRLLGRADTVTEALRTDLPHLRTIAIAAALRAGVDTEVTVPTRAGVVAVPTLGSVYGLGDGMALLRTGAGNLEAVGPSARVRVAAPLHRAVPGWAPRPELDLGGLVLAVEESDPYRDCYPWRPRGRLERIELDRTARVLTGAWRMIQQEHPTHATAMTLALRSVVPIAGPSRGRVSAASRLAYGSVAISIPDEPAVAALLLLHEFQHMKLGGLLDLVPLHRTGGAARHLAPWRADPRPVGALLQGTYAHLGVTDFWRGRRQRGPDRRLAEFEFAYWLSQTTRAAETLACCGELTAEGQDFVRALRGTLRAWAADPSPGEVSAGVRVVVDAAVIRWRLANARPTGAVVARLRDQWLRGAAPGPVPQPNIRPAAAAPAALTGLPGRIREILTDPGQVAADSAGEGGWPTDCGSSADQDFLAGDFASSVASYQRRVMDSGDDESWTGLALAMSAADMPGARAIGTAPELVRALHSALRSAGTDSRPAPDARTLEPRHLAVWLSAAFDDAPD